MPTPAPSRPSPIDPPIAPMLARAADALPEAGDFLFEPKWDGFRAIVFRRGDEALIQGRDGRPLNRWFPELEAALVQGLAKGVVVDGEVVVARAGGLDFDALQQRLHPAASRIARLSQQTPASFVAFDLLAAGGRSTRELPQHERRVRLERLFGSVGAPLHLTPATRDRALAAEWLDRFQGAGLDGVIARPADAPYRPAKRAILKIKPVRSADCVVAGVRFWKRTDDAIGALLLGLHDAAGVLRPVGTAGSFTMRMRRELAEALAPLRTGAATGHPWAGRDLEADAAVRRGPGAASGADDAADADRPWELLRPERVAEVRWDHLLGDRFRDAATFLRWRLDKPAADCGHDQLAVATPRELREVFGARIGGPAA